MPAARCYSTLRLVNGSTGDPVLYIDSPGRDNAILFDTGDNGALSLQELADLDAVFITHHHVDHFIGLDRIVRANMDRDKTLQIFGPTGTIRKVYDRITSYEYPYFPFQKIVLRVSEILPDAIDSALLVCTDRFPEPQLERQPRSGRLIYETPSIQVETVAVDHTVPCQAYALIEKPGWHLLRDRLRGKTNHWAEQALELARNQASPETLVAAPQAAPITLHEFCERYCVDSPGARVAFVTDTAWTPAIRQGLLDLCRHAWRLYGDCFYAIEQATSAATYHHMTTREIGELARQAEVEELVLIHFATRYVHDYQRLVSQVREVFPHVTADFDRR